MPISAPDLASDAEVRRAAVAYLHGDIDLDGLDEAVTAALWEEPPDALRSTSHLVGELGLMLAEHSSGHVLEGQLRRELHDLVERYWFAPRPPTSMKARFTLLDPIRVPLGAGSA